MLQLIIKLLHRASLTVWSYEYMGTYLRGNAPALAYSSCREGQKWTPRRSEESLRPARLFCRYQIRNSGQHVRTDANPSV